MKDFIETLKSVPDMFRQYVRVFKIAQIGYAWKIRIYIAVGVVIAFLGYIRNYIQGNLINGLQTFSVNHNMAILTVPLILFIAMLVLPSFLNIFQQYLNKDYRFAFQKRLMLMKTLKDAEVDPQLLEQAEFTNLKNKIESKGVMVLSNYYADFNNYLMEVLVLIVSSITIFKFSKPGFLILFLTSIPILITRMKYGSDSWFIWGNDVDTEKRKKMQYYRSYFEHFKNYIEIRLTKSYKYFINFIDNFFDGVYKDQRELENKLFKYSILTALISISGVVYVVFIFLNQVIAGDIKIGTFTFALSLIVSFNYSLSYMFTRIGFIYPDYKYVKTFFEFIDTKSVIQNTGTKKFENKAPVIEFKNVYFKYPDSAKYILEDFNLKINTGDKLAVIGLNGAGKTTFVKLLCRFYDVTEGEILFNGVNIKEYDLESWYEILGVLFQEYGKYEIPLNELVILGRYDNTIDDKTAEKNVKHALKLAEAEFVKKLPNKEITQLGKEFTDGVDVSVGQWQKLAIARMFYRDPAVMILDEPTSSIDAEAEMKIFETLEKFSKQKTVIMISHRFSTVRNADKICVINEGRVYEHGTHEELLNLNGEYARLFNLQAEGYK